MAFVGGQLVGPARSAVEDHIDDCPQCRQLLAELVRKGKTVDLRAASDPAMRETHLRAPPPPQAPSAAWVQQFNPVATAAHPAPTTRLQKRRFLIPAFAATAIVPLVIGILIGRGCRGSVAPPPAPAMKLSQLGVTSKPVDGNVTVDGRFVGVSPVERVDLDAGKHTVVVDAFGYQPYAGTVEMDPEARTTLKVLLVPLGGSGSTGGELVGQGGKSTTSPVPQSALSFTGIGVSKDAPKPAGAPKRSAPSYSSYTPPPPAPEPPPRPRRDCSGEKSTCRDSCSRANGDCRFNCPNCVGCSSSIGEAECRRTCDSCRAGCEQNVKFCESSCDSNYSSCEASNR